MKIALTVLGNGRTGYLHQAIQSAFEYLPPMDAYLMVDDSGNPDVANELRDTYGEQFDIIHHPQNLGMAAAVQSVFAFAVSHDVDYVFHLEEDFILTAPIPISDAIRGITAKPQVVAQILFQRQPLTPDEHAAGTVLGGMGIEQGPGEWTAQRHIFSLNPCIIPRTILERGWPPGNEREQTDRLIADGYWFGVWHGQHCEHIGHERASVWQL